MISPADAVHLGVPAPILHLLLLVVSLGVFGFILGRRLALLRAGAPGPVQRVGLEWAWRWAQEPRRLASRYGLGGVRFLKALVLGRQPE